MPGPRRLNLHPGALRAHVHGVRHIQHALVDHRRRPDRLVRARLDREGGGVLGAVLGCLAPGPGIAVRGLDRQLASSDKWDADCER